MKNNTIIVRGGGDIASGVIQKLHRSGFKVLVLEIENPTFIRRNVCLGEAIYSDRYVVEDMESLRADNITQINEAWDNGLIPVAVDPSGYLINTLKPDIVVDAILAKKNIGTTRAMANITVALGPGFEAGKDVDVVIETNRGHNLGRLIFSGCASKNTGTPGEIMGFSKERVIYSPCDGVMKNCKDIGDIVKRNDTIAKIGHSEIKATIDGVLRGLLRDGASAHKGLKIADIDPRLKEKNNCSTISDKARNIGGGVLEAIFYLKDK